MKINNETYIEDRFIVGVKENEDSIYLPLLLETGDFGRPTEWVYFNMCTVSNRREMAYKVIDMLNKRGE